MPRMPVVVLVLAVLAAVGAAAAAAQHDHGHDGTPAAATPYAGRYDLTAAVRSLTPDEIAQIERGQGAGFALPAELNGVPGPRHALDLAEELGLSDEQVARVRAVYDELQAAVLPAGRRYLDALRALEEEFRAGTLAEADLPARGDEV